MTPAAHIPGRPRGSTGTSHARRCASHEALRAARGSLLSATGTAPSRLTPTKNAEISR